MIIDLLDSGLARVAPPAGQHHVYRVVVDELTRDLEPHAAVGARDEEDAGRAGHWKFWKLKKKKTREWKSFTFRRRKKKKKKKDKMARLPSALALLACFFFLSVEAFQMPSPVAEAKVKEIDESSGWEEKKREREGFRLIY